MKLTSLLKNANGGWLAATVLATMLVTGCGGGSSAPPAVTSNEVPASVGSSVAAMVNYLTSLFALTSDTTEPMGVNALTLAVDDTVEPTTLP